jgi:hypothetical protein
MKLMGHDSIDGIQSPELAEAMAVRQALAIARYKDFMSIVLASDRLSLTQKIQATGTDRSSVGTVVGDIKRLAAEFPPYFFKHVNRLCNSAAAHNLARSFELSLCKLFCRCDP